uniref:Uncharacterized protein n=1 Tax=Panagrolaimus sp. ES5 TaxID=591445 RepID=A0AC34FVU4_9BILA
MSSADVNLLNASVKIPTEFLGIIMSPNSNISFATSSLKIINKFSKAELSAVQGWPYIATLFSEEPINITFSFLYGNVSCPWKITNILKNNLKTTYQLNSELTIIGNEFIVECHCNSYTQIQYFVQEITPTTINPIISNQKKNNLIG